MKRMIVVLTVMVIGISQISAARAQMKPRFEINENMQTFEEVKRKELKRLSRYVKFAKRKKKKKKDIDTSSIFIPAGNWAITVPGIPSGNADIILEITAIFRDNFVFNLWLPGSNSFLSKGFGVIDGNNIAFVESFLGGEILYFATLESNTKAEGNSVFHLEYDCEFPIIGSPTCRLSDDPFFDIQRIELRKLD